MDFTPPQYTQAVILKFVVTTIIILLSAAVIAIFVAMSGMHNVAASEPHGALAQWFFSTVSEASVERRARDIKVPDLENEQMILAGLNDYESMCAECHGRPGSKPSALAKGLNPPPPNFGSTAPDESPAELFWVTKYGIKMTGMPAWGVTHDDESLWSVVAFLKALPEFDAATYQAMKTKAAGMGHHADANTGTHDPEAGQVTPDKPISETESKKHDPSDHKH